MDEFVALMVFALCSTLFALGFNWLLNKVLDIFHKESE